MYNSKASVDKGPVIIYEKEGKEESGGSYLSAQDLRGRVNLSAKDLGKFIYENSSTMHQMQGFEVQNHKNFPD